MDRKKKKKRKEEDGCNVLEWAMGVDFGDGVELSGKTCSAH